MQPLVWRLGTLVLAFFTLVVFASTSEPQAKEPLRRSEYGAFALVCKRELSALGETSRHPMCVHVPPSKIAPASLLKYLRSSGVPVSASTACYPKGELPRGLEISVREIRRGPGLSLSIKVETGDITIKPDSHFGELLRFGTYRLSRTSGHQWSIVDYVDEMPKN